MADDKVNPHLQSVMRKTTSTQFNSFDPDAGRPKRKVPCCRKKTKKVSKK